MKSAGEKRRSMRNPDTGRVTFFVLESAKGPENRERTGTLVDSSGEGIGLVTDDGLEPGNRITYYLSGIRHSGIVMWTLDTENQYRVGVRITSKQSFSA